MSLSPAPPGCSRPVTLGIHPARVWSLPGRSGLARSFCLSHQLRVSPLVLRWAPVSVAIEFPEQLSGGGKEERAGKSETKLCSQGEASFHRSPGGSGALEAESSPTSQGSSPEGAASSHSQWTFIAAEPRRAGWDAPSSCSPCCRPRDHTARRALVPSASATGIFPPPRISRIHPPDRGHFQKLPRDSSCGQDWDTLNFN